jgi:3-hydroxybutyryl-CoA dehydrogenase
MSVAVIGAGTMGAGIASLFRAAGHDVRLFDTRAEALEAAARATGAAPCAYVSEAVAGAELCLEAIVEELEPKRELFAELARVAEPDCVLATNTSALRVAAIADGLPDAARRRVLGAHFFNPPDIVPAVEVVRTAHTAGDAVERTMRLLREAGKVPAIVADVAGFAANRIQHAMVLEAWRCLEEGVADAEAIDAIVSGSFGFRLFAFGPFQLGDFNGLDVYRSVHETLRDAYGERFAPPRSLMALVEEGAVGTKAGRGVFDYRDVDVARLTERRDALLRRLAAVRARELPPAAEALGA